MTKRTGYDLDALRERELKQGSPFEPLILGGETFNILPESLWGDEMFSGDVVKMATALLGEEEHARFIAAGGTSSLLIVAFNELQGATIPQS